MSAEPAEQFNINDAKTNLSRIIERVERGEEIVIGRAGRPVAKVIPLVRTVSRTARRSLRGKLTLPADWDSAETNALTHVVLWWLLDDDTLSADRAGVWAS